MGGGNGAFPGRMGGSGDFVTSGGGTRIGGGLGQFFSANWATCPVTDSTDSATSATF